MVWKNDTYLVSEKTHTFGVRTVPEKIKYTGAYHLVTSYRLLSFSYQKADTLIAWTLLCSLLYHLSLK